MMTPITWGRPRDPQGCARLTHTHTELTLRYRESSSTFCSSCVRSSLWKDLSCRERENTQCLGRAGRACLGSSREGTGAGLHRLRGPSRAEEDAQAMQTLWSSANPCQRGWCHLGKAQKSIFH